MADTLEQLIPLFSDIMQKVEQADYSEVFREVLPILTEQEQRMFDEERDSSGRSWPPLAQSTIVKKGHDQILVDTGALRKSLVDIDDSFNIHEIQPRELIFGTSDPKALYHQEGTGRMPARPPVGISDETAETIAEFVADETVRIILET